MKKKDKSYKQDPKRIHNFVISPLIRLLNEEEYNKGCGMGPKYMQYFRDREDKCLGWKYFDYRERNRDLCIMPPYYTVNERGYDVLVERCKKINESQTNIIIDGFTSTNISTDGIS